MNMKQVRKKAYFKDFLRSGLLLLDYSVPNLNRYRLSCCSLMPFA